MSTRLLVDSDTASDDALALLLLARAAGVDLEAVTVVAGNAPFDRQVANARYALELAGVDVPVHEGERSPLDRAVEHATEVHGETGLGDRSPAAAGGAAGEDGVGHLLEATRAAPGELTLCCLGPLTNVARAMERDPGFLDRLDDLWVMGGAANCAGNVTPAAEFNFYVDPAAARRVVRNADCHLVDWGVCVRDARLGADVFDAAAAAGTRFGDFFVDAFATSRAFTRGQLGFDGVIAPDAVVAAALIDLSVVTASARRHVDVDDRDGMTRGYSLVDERGVLDAPARTRLVESVDGAAFRAMVERTLRGDRPDAPQR